MRDLKGIGSPRVVPGRLARTALALYDESLKWANRAEGLPNAGDFVQILTRERSCVRQQETMAQAAAIGGE